MTQIAGGPKSVANRRGDAAGSGQAQPQNAEATTVSSAESPTVSGAEEAGSGDQLEEQEKARASHLAARDAGPAKDARVGTSASFGLAGLIGENRKATDSATPTHTPDSAPSGALFDVEIGPVRVGISPGPAVGVAPIDENLGLSAISLPRGNLPASENQPSLIVDPARVGELRSRVTRPPYTKWNDKVLSDANRALSRKLSQASMTERDRSASTKACAYAYTLTGDARYLAKAQEGLSHIGPPNDVDGLLELSQGGSRGGSGWERHLTSGESMHNYAAALDLLKGELDQSAIDHAADALTAQGEFMQRAMPLIPNNNWKTRSAAGLGSAALALNGVGRHEEAKGLLNTALGGIERGMAQASPDGVYNEGPSYAEYANATLIPFVRQYQSATGVNLAADPELRAYFEGTVSTRMPNGRQPAFDDAHSSTGSRHAMLVDPSMPGAENYRFDFDRAASKHMGGQSGEAIAYFDDRVAVPREPSLPPTRLQQEGGQAVFRSGYEPDATYAMFAAERRAAPGHEHIDPGNVMLTAHGKNLLIPPGYGPEGYFSENRDDYRGAAAHNVVLVEGQTARSGEGVEMAGMYDAGGLQGAAERHNVGDTELRRHVTFVDNKYMVLDDETRSPGARQVDVLLHGNGELERASSKGATWNVDGVRLQAVYLGDSRAVNTRDAVHSYAHNEEDHHTAVSATMDGDKNHLVTVLLPVAEGERAQVKKVASEGPGEAKRVATGQQGRGDLIMVGDGETEIRTRDASLIGRTAIVRDGDGDLAGFSLRDASRFDHKGKPVCSSDRPINLALDMDAQGARGFVSAPNGPTKVFLDLGGRPPQDALFDGRPIDIHSENGRPYITVEGAGTLDLAFSGRAHHATRGAEVPPPDDPRLIDRIAAAPDPQQAIQGLNDAERAQLESQIATQVGRGLYDSSVTALASALKTTPERVATVAAVGAGWLQYFGETGQLPVDIALDTVLAGVEAHASVSTTLKTEGGHSVDAGSLSLRGDNARANVYAREREEGVELGGSGSARLRDGSRISGGVSTGPAGTQVNADLSKDGLRAGVDLTATEKRTHVGGHVSGAAGEAELGYTKDEDGERISAGGSTQLGGVEIDHKSSVDKAGLVSTETGAGFAGESLSGHGRLGHHRDDGQRLSGGLSYDRGALHANADADLSHQDGKTSLDGAGLGLRTRAGKVGLGAWGSRALGPDGKPLHSLGGSAATSLGGTGLGLGGQIADDGSQSLHGSVTQPLGTGTRLDLLAETRRHNDGLIVNTVRAELLASNRGSRLRAKAQVDFDEAGVRRALAELSYQKVDYSAYLRGGYDRHAGANVRAGLSWNIRD